MITLGDVVRDTVSGFRGVAIGKTEFLNGCKRIGVQPIVRKDGTLPEAQWFDAPQLEVVALGARAKASASTGGPMVSIPTRNASPNR